MNAIDLHGISKRYNIYDRPIDRLKEIVWRNRRCFHREFWALRNIDLTVKAGESVALIGPNGSGKSSLLQIIASIIKPTTGSLDVKGRVTAILELGAGFQPDYTGRDNVLLNGMILGISKEEMLSKMEAIADFAEIGDFFDQPIKTYSSGMVVRLAFAVVTTVDPEILLVDEALAVGDSRFQAKCFKKIQALREAGKTIIFVSHDMLAVRDYCQSTVLMNGGKIQARGPVEEIVPLYQDLMLQPDAVAPKVFTLPTDIVQPLNAGAHAGV